MHRIPTIYTLVASVSKIIIGLFFISLLLIKTATTSYAGEIGIPKVFPGTHISKITGLSVANNGELLISSSQDGAIHFWKKRNDSWEIVRSIYGSKDEEIFAMAVSPDEETLVVAGSSNNKRFNYYMKMYDLKNGDVKKIVKAHQNTINTLNFSRDGRYLLSAGADNEVRIWSTNQWELHKTLQGHTGFITNATFIGVSHNIVSASSNGEVILWNNNFKQKVKLTGDDYSKPVYRLAISGNGRQIIFGKGRIFYHYDNKGLKLQEIDLSTSGDISSVEFGINGKTAKVFIINPNKVFSIDLSAYDSVETNLVTEFDKERDCSAIVTTTVHRDAGIFSGDICGNILLGSESNNRVLGGHLNLNGVSNIRLTQARDKVMWEISAPEKQTYQLELNKQAKDFNDPMVIKNPSMKNFGVLHEYRSKRTERTNDGEELRVFDKQKLLGTIRKSSNDGFKHIAYTFLANGESIVSGGANGSLIQYSLDGEIEAEFKGHHDRLLSVAVTHNGKYLISGATDNTLRIWSLKNKELLLSTYHHPDGKRWVTWAPSGYYKVSQNGLSIFGWVFDKGLDQKTKYINAAQVSRKLYRPDIIDSILRGDPKDNIVFTENDLGDIPEIVLLSPKKQ